ncbi:helix-turn-helix domain-containing protein [Sulfitobacter sp. F26169L]|uniref:helix-turn-helix domain-containing protein n=1 Tax=Sulfitobacter sp. F26169L TaxID=2996015 RepID=UPI002260F608|nr:helix-turn-helix domain-containing protein [Sulfitobacter sp. F26169L]MCX7568138.1 helix-turn-helix domain-containing protein [Sulfitobacter sp. F26169L]
MSKIFDCDPNRGFVAFPVALFDLDLSPAAFRTLAELCRMANASGQCWPSLAQLGRRLGRSRASISGYISELRAAGLLTTEEQKMANGYNYRLRYTVTFWKEWRAGLGKDQKAATPAPVKKPERRVQPIERPLKTKNHIHKKQHESVGYSDLISGWKTTVGNAPYPEFTQWPDDGLLSATDAAIAGAIEPAPIISADIEAGFGALYEKLGLGPVPETLMRDLAPQIPSQAALTVILEKLEEAWQPHWKKQPTLHQINRLISTLPPICNAETEQKLLKSYLRRWKLHLRSLPSVAIRSKVAA